MLLNNGQENQYTLNNIKTVNELPKHLFTIKTNMNAKHFYLIAVSNEDDIKTFAKAEIVDDFKQGKTNMQKGEKLIQLPLIEAGYSLNILYIFLLGIDEEWNYDYHFVGGIILDMIGPILDWELAGSTYGNFGYSGNILNLSPIEIKGKFKDFYIKYGEYSHKNSSIRNITWGNFEGNDYWGYPITLSVNFNRIGDIDHLVLQGKKYKIKWSDITDRLGNNPRFIFEHRFPRLNIGDNYINIKFVDKSGNASTGKINITTQSICDKGVEINNSIYNEIN